MMNSSKFPKEFSEKAKLMLSSKGQSIPYRASKLLIKSSPKNDYHSY
jgi:hypothetical protein